MQNSNMVYKYYLLGRCQKGASPPNAYETPAELIAAWSLGVHENEVASNATLPPEIRCLRGVVRRVEEMMGVNTSR